jgi:hypothetical protein
MHKSARGSARDGEIGRKGGEEGGMNPRQEEGRKEGGGVKKRQGELLGVQKHGHRRIKLKPTEMNTHAFGTGAGGPRRTCANAAVMPTFEGGPCVTCVNSKRNLDMSQRQLLKRRRTFFVVATGGLQINPIVAGDHR